MGHRGMWGVSLSGHRGSWGESLEWCMGYVGVGAMKALGGDRGMWGGDNQTMQISQGKFPYRS